MATAREATFTVPADAKTGDTVHLIFEVSDSPGNATYTSLTTYKRVVLTVVSYADLSAAVQKRADEGQLPAQTAAALLAFVDEALEQTAAGNTQAADSALRSLLDLIGTANPQRVSVETQAELVTLATELQDVLKAAGGIPANHRTRQPHPLPVLFQQDIVVCRLG